MTAKSFQQAVNAIRRAHTVIIAGHINPDGDCLGSLLALGLGLKSLGKRVSMVKEGRIPSRYALLPAARLLKDPPKAEPGAHLAISVDCNTPDMLGKRVASLFKKSKQILEIDHHEFRRPFGDISLIETEAAAVGEIIYRLLSGLRVTIIDDIAQNILTSIIVETNSFRLPSVRSYTFSVCAELLKSGVDFYKLSEMVYWSKTAQTALLSGVCLSRAVFLKKERIVWSLVTRKDFKKTKGRDEDVDAVADEMRAIKSVLVAVLFREQDAKTLRVSIRSKGRINVAQVAERFGGGGHGDVAGCFIPNSHTSIQAFLRVVQRLLP